MKMKVLIAVSIATSSLMAASPDSLNKNQKGILDFVAPTVNDVSNVNTNQDGGTIVYDAVDGLFKGKNWGNNGWQVLSPTSGVQHLQLQMPLELYS